MWRLVVGALGMAACAAPAAQPAAPAESIIESVPATSAAPTAPTAVSGATSQPPATSAPAVVPEGFDRVAARVTEPDGSTCDLCLWLADTSRDRARGLMFVTDLGVADGMLFRYGEPVTTRFHMTNTLLPLSIAFFATDGSHMGAFDMEPCERTPCTRYPTPAGFTMAVETVQGDLPELGMVPGSTLELLDDPCP